MSVSFRFSWVIALVALACEHAPLKNEPERAVMGGGSGGSAGGPGGGGRGGTAGGGAVGGEPVRPEPPGPPCNTWPALCERAYDAVSYPVAHASMANSASFWLFPAQRRSVRKQLDDGIRGLWLEVHAYEGETTLCFVDCAEGHAPLAPELADVRAFLDDNPREVVTLLVDNRVPAADMENAFDDAELAPYLFTETAPTWPTLGAMIDANRRLVVFLENASGAGDGYRPFDDVARTTGAATRALELDCDVERGSLDDPFLLANQFLVDGVGNGAGGEGGGQNAGRPSAGLSESVNRNPELGERLSACTRAWGRKPNFVAVDFYDTSDVMTATQRLDALVP